jgi:hypothetical protein
MEGERASAKTLSASALRVKHLLASDQRQDQRGGFQSPRKLRETHCVTGDSPFHSPSRPRGVGVELGAFAGQREGVCGCGSGHWAVHHTSGSRPAYRPPGHYQRAHNTTEGTACR